MIAFTVTALLQDSLHRGKSCKASSSRVGIQTNLPHQLPFTGSAWFWVSEHIFYSPFIVSHYVIYFSYVSPGPTHATRGQQQRQQPQGGYPGQQAHSGYPGQHREYRRKSIASIASFVVLTLISYRRCSTTTSYSCSKLRPRGCR